MRNLVYMVKKLAGYHKMKKCKRKNLEIWSPDPHLGVFPSFPLPTQCCPQTSGTWLGLGRKRPHSTSLMMVFLNSRLNCFSVLSSACLGGNGLSLPNRVEPRPCLSLLLWLKKLSGLRKEMEGATKRTLKNHCHKTHMFTVEMRKSR